MRRVISVLGGAALLLAGGSAAAQAQQCDLVTGGGYITSNGANANFGVGGSCKVGGDAHVLWGHLEYIDHSTGLDIHWATITGYFACTDRDPTDLSTCVSNPSGQPPGTRLICGTAGTNQTSSDVNFAVTVTDYGGKNTDFFSILVPDLPPSPYHRSGFLQGGNIQLHKPIFSGTQAPTCPALVAGPTGCLSDTDCATGQMCLAGVCVDQCPPGTVPPFEANCHTCCPDMQSCQETFAGSGEFACAPD